ncbi:MAG: prolyl oligopeptidase family serine peptidase [Gammaproteobacteria bacterium]|nr:prolyl oligopeptidase family serine peptidase [Gammaproteobacteria bacterium]
MSRMSLFSELQRRAVSRVAVACLAGSWLILVIANTPRLNAAELPPLTLDHLLSTPSLTGVVPSSPVWSPDSRHFAFTWNNEGLPYRQIWIATQDGRELRQLGSATNTSLSVRDIAWLPDGKTILSLRGSELWSTTLDNKQHTLLVTVGRGASNLSVSPDGKRAAYLKGGDLWLVDLGSGAASAATDVGISGLSSLPVGRYSRPEREIGPGIWGGPTYAWSPDGRYVAVHYVDRRGMRKVPFPNYLAPETEPNEVRRGYPGDANEYRTVGLLKIANLDLQLLALDNPTESQVVDFAWSADGVLLLDLASDTAVDRWLYTVEPEDGELRAIWHSNRPSRIYTSFASAWHPDGKQVVFLSDLNDRYGLYAIDATVIDAEPRQLTDPGYDVLGSPAVVAPADAIFFAANGTGAYERHVYRVNVNGGKPRRITTMPGQNSGFPSPDGRHVAILHSDDVSPPELYVATADGGDTMRVTTSPLPEFSQRKWTRGRYVSFPSDIDDYTLHARILEPPDLDPSRKYPVIFGPMYSNTVRNRWAGVYSQVQQLMVQKGYIVVQLDLRGSTGYGREFREEFLVDFAGDDIEDIASTVNYMKTIPYVDPQRLGIWGSSYGGTLTIYSLLKKPGLFRAGVAAAAAVDPHFFGTDDVAIVRRPDSDPEIYKNIARRYAANLEDHLLIIHGMQDQVVPFKTTAVLAEELIKNGKDFDFAFAPGATHAWSREPYYQQFLFRKLLAHFDRYLMSAGLDPDSSDGPGE